MKVCIVSGIELKNVDLIGTIDPFCKCYIEVQPDNVKTTSVVNNSNNPSWNFNTEFYIDTRKL